jgi:hypothetical protein
MLLTSAFLNVATLQNNFGFRRRKPRSHNTPGNVTQEGDAKAGQPEAVCKQGPCKRVLIAMRMGQNTGAGSNK